MTDLVSSVLEALDDLKAQETVVMDVMPMSEVMDTLIISSGSSSRHVKSLANNVIDELKKQGVRPIGVEGIEASDWVLVDYGSVVVHVMLPQTRRFYDLEKLWSPINEDGSFKEDQSMPSRHDTK